MWTEGSSFWRTSPSGQSWASGTGTGCSWPSLLLHPLSQASQSLRPAAESLMTTLNKQHHRQLTVCASWPPSGVPCAIWQLERRNYNWLIIIPRTTWLTDVTWQGNIKYTDAMTLPRDRNKWTSVGQRWKRGFHQYICQRSIDVSLVVKDCWKNNFRNYEK